MRARASCTVDAVTVGRPGSLAAVAHGGGDNHLDAVALPQQRIERVAIADQSVWEVGEEPAVEHGGDEVRLIR